eukprot:gb/GECG01006358.1/.p1 GENE.gb/GECG01006358.1/~~gb/GECG01006358.1/.p1  ORF type:complete len:741 (+),score=92.89 gb/GECG01006358.1/:1-2223(+)
MPVPRSLQEVAEHEQVNISQEELRELGEYMSDTEFEQESPDHGPNERMDNIIVIDHVPQAGPEKYDRLCSFMKRVVTQVAPITENGLYIPQNPQTKLTEGFAFVEFQDVEGAKRAVGALNGFRLDAKHTLLVDWYVELDDHCSVEEKFTRPKLPEYKRFDDLWSWLGDSLLRDQFAIRYDDETEIHWAETNAAPVPQYCAERQKAEGRKWTDNHIKWSPQGTFFVTFHLQGVLLWGGSDFHEFARFAHRDAHQVLISPCERYIGTWNGRSGNFEPDDAFIVWNLRSGAKLRAFRQEGNSDDCDFVWSPDGNYIGRMGRSGVTGKEAIEIYEVSDTYLTLLGRTKINAPSAQELQFAPGGSHNLLATWTPEGQNQPASVTMIKVPSKEVVRSKQLFNVEDIKMHWHPQGNYLAVQAILLSKAQAKKKKRQQESGAYEGELTAEKKGAVVTTFELFRVSEKMVPVETMKVEGAVHDFAWEPNGTRFAVVHGAGPLRFNVSFYEMEPKETPEKAKARTPASVGGAARAEFLHTLQERPANRLFWSPRGGLIVIAGLENIGGELEFFDVDALVTYGTGEHMQCNRVKWDPSGRLVATVKKQPMVGEVRTRDTVENGFQLWNFLGRRIYDENKTSFYKFIWRPRPSLLDDEEQKQVQKNLKKFIQKYQDEDRAREARRKLLRVVRKRRLRDEFRTLLATRQQEYERDYRPQRIAMGAEPGNPDEGYEIQRYTMDQIIDQHTESVQ